MPLFACPQCKTQLQIPEGMEGKQVRCSQCNGILQIPANVGVTTQPRPAQPARPAPAAPAPPAGLGFDNGPTFAPNPPQPGLIQRLRNMPIWMLGVIGGGIFAAVFILVLTILLWPSGGLASANLVYLPDDCVILYAVNVDKVRNSALASELKSLGLNVDDSMEDWASRLGVALNDIKPVYYAKTADGEEVKLMRLKRAYTPKKILESTWFSSTEYDAIEVAGQKIHEAVGGLSTSICAIDSYKILYGSTDAIKAILRRGGPPKLSPALQAAVDSVDFSRALAGAADVKRATKTPVGLGKKFKLMPLSMAFDADLTSKLTSKLVVTFETAQVAEDAKKIAEGFKLFGKYVAEAAPGVSDGGPNIWPGLVRDPIEAAFPTSTFRGFRSPTALAQVFEDVELSASGSKLTATVDIDVIGVMRSVPSK